MKYRFAFAALLLCLSPVASGQLPTSANASAYRALCRVDDEILPADRNEAEKAALEFVQAAMSGNPDKTLSLMTKEVQSGSPKGGIVLTNVLKSNRPFQNIHVAHSYFIEVSGAAGNLPQTDCYKMSGSPDRVALSMRALPRQFHVEVVARTMNNDWSMFVWLVPEANSLKVLALNFTTSSLAGRNSQDLLRMAREQKAKGHVYNAAFLLQAAETVSSRGPYVTPFWKTELDKEAKAFVQPKDFDKISPFQWHVGEQVFELQRRGVMGVGGNLYLTFDRTLTNWSEDAVADKDNQAFVTALVKAYPEFSDSFQGIIARAHKPNGIGGFTTVYELGKSLTQRQ